MANRDQREAGWKEVLEQVSVADVGRQGKSILIGLFMWAIWLAICAGAEVGVSAAGWGFHVPKVVWTAIAVFMFVMILTSDRSYHEWTLRLFFPKLGFVGWIIATAYLTLIIEAFRLTRSMSYGFVAVIAAGGIYLGLIAPGILLLGLLELGHDRLMEKRASGNGGALEALTPPNH